MSTLVKEASKTISTGNTEIDKKLGGGIPRGSLLLIEGHSDSGKSVLTQQMTWGSLKDGNKVTVLTTENTVKSLIRQMDSLSLGVLDHFLLGKLKIYPIKATKARNGTEMALLALQDAVMSQEAQDLVVIDSVTSFISSAPQEQVVSFFEECKVICGRGMTVAVVAHTYAFKEGTLVRLSSMCDAHLCLSIENLGDKLLMVMEVSKVRGAQQKTGNVVSFDVEPGWGMRIIPFTKARA